MAYLWFRDDDCQWSVLSLATQSLDIESSPPKTFTTEGSNSAKEGCTIVAPTDGDGQEGSWAVVWGRSKKIKVNGLRMATGIRALSHGDEIKVGDNVPIYFSTEVLARIETFEGSEEPLVCPRCKQVIEPGSAVVRCPGCSVLHHEAGDLNCWSFAPKCSMCDNPTGIDEGFQWVPGDDVCG